MSDSCDPMDCSLPGSSVHGILQATILEWVAISFSRFYIFSCRKVFSAGLQVVLIDSCSVSSCKFCVLVTGSELRVFLLHHCGHISSVKGNSAAWMKLEDIVLSEVSLSQ